MLFNFVAVYVFQGLHSIAVFKNILYLCHKWFPSVVVSTARKNIQTEKVFCWHNDAFIYHIWSQHGYELITLLRWANQNAGNAITIVQLHATWKKSCLTKVCYSQLLHSAVEHVEKKARGQEGILTLFCKNFDLVKLKFNSIEEALNVASSVEVLSTIGKKNSHHYYYNNNLHIIHSKYFSVSDWLKSYA